MPYSVREGINVFLAGFIPTENMRFRDYELSFKISLEESNNKKDQISHFKYPSMKKTFKNAKGESTFELEIHGSNF